MEDFSRETVQNKEKVFELIALLQERKKLLTGKNEVNLKPAGKRLTKVCPGRNGKKVFNFGPETRKEVNVPVKYKGIDYYVLIQHIKKNNADAVKMMKRHRVDYTLNMVEDTLEYLSYIKK